MQLGTRWDVGTPAPAALPDAVLRGIDRVEVELDTDGVDSAGWRWTLTWLEGRPIVELDDGTRIIGDEDGASILPRADEY